MKTQTISYINNLLEDKKNELCNKVMFLEEELHKAELKLHDECQDNNIQCFGTEYDNLPAKKKVDDLYCKRGEITGKYNEIEDIYEDFITHKW